MRGGGTDGPRRRRVVRATVAASCLLVAASIPFDLVPWLRGPAPYPPEWQWAFRSGGPDRPLVAAALVAFLLLGLLGASGTGRARRRPEAASRLLVVGAVLLGWTFQIALLVREPGSPLLTLLSRTRSRSFTSYHAVAVSDDARDPLRFLRRHADLLPAQARSARHAATHPPGPVLFYRAAIAACGASPSLTEALLQAAGVPEREFPPPDTRPARAAALLGALVLGLLGAATAWPVFRLAEALGAARLPAARLSVLWALLPGPALMTPQIDQALALPVAAATALLARAAIESRPRRSAFLAALAGLLGGVSVFTSYGAAAFLAIGGVAALSAAAGRPAPTGTNAWRRPAMLALGATAVSAALACGGPALLGHEPLRAAATALSIHRGVYTEPRSYPLWLAFNPLDLAVFLGLPIAFTALLRLGAPPAGEPARLRRFRTSLGVGVGLLFLLGVTRGEVGRIWIPLMPLLLVAALAGGEDEPDRSEAVFHGLLLAVLTLAIGAYWDV